MLTSVRFIKNYF